MQVRANTQAVQYMPRPEAVYVLARDQINAAVPLLPQRDEAQQQLPLFFRDADTQLLGICP